MTRLNYVNRKSTGLKLGQIVQKDLRKRLTTSTSKHDSQSLIELGLDGKDLTDACIEAFAPTLTQILVPTRGFSASHLHVLHLQHNGLTAQSLQHLAPVIEASSQNLEDLDLSNNVVCITTTEDIDPWETFLTAFHACCILRRLSLAGNDFSDPNALEVFSRAYMRQYADNAVALGTSEDDNNGAEIHMDELEDSLNILSVRDTNVHGRVTTPAKTRAPTPEDGGDEVLGLPMIQVIDISGVSLTDTGALFLSWVIERHRFVQNSIRRKIWGQPQEGQGCAMIVTTGNDKLTSAGNKLLGYAESAAYHPFGALDVLEQRDAVFRQEDAPLSESRRTSGASTHIRRVSDISSAQEPIGRSPAQNITSAHELDSLRKRIQRSTIEDFGVTKIQLWRNAIRLLCLVRRTMTDGGWDTAKLANSPTTYAMAVSDQVAEQGRPIYTNMSGLSLDDHEEFPKPPTLTLRVPAPTYAATLTVSKDGKHRAERALPRGPAQVLLGSKSRGRKDSLVADRTMRTEPGIASRTLGCHERALERMTVPTPRMVGPLPVQAWHEVLSLLADPECALSGRQRRSVIKYGQDRRTLMVEIDVLGKSRGTQVWLVLDRMGCLMYDDVE